MKFTRLSILLFAFLAVFGLWSCGPSKEDQNQNSEEFNQAEESLKDQIKDLVYNIPSPSEIPYLLQATGAEFNQSLLKFMKSVDLWIKLPHYLMLH